MAPGAAAPAASLRERQRARLIDACISALHVHGPSRTTIDKVVAIADMSPGIVNFYFETKAALLVAALEYLGAEFEARVLAPLEALRDEPARALPRLVELYLDADIASPRKVSVWYAFWGEASSRAEYQQICGRRDQAFADLVGDLVARLIGALGAAHLDAVAVALGLIGVLEMMWQDIAFREEADIDRAGARRRAMAYLASVFPTAFGAGAALPQALRGADALAQLVAAELRLAGLQAFAMPADFLGFSVAALGPAGPARILVRHLGAAPPAAGGAHDWVAVVGPRAALGGRRIFIMPAELFDTGGEFPDWAEGNFGLRAS